MSRHQVKLFALSTCGHCRSARKLLDDHRYDYECIEVDLAQGEDRDAIVEEVRTHNPRVSFPTMVIDGGERVIVGYKESEIREALEL